MIDLTLEADDHDRWMREVLTDFRIPFDDHKNGRRVALTQWMHDLRAHVEELEGLLREAHDVCTTRVREPAIMARIATRIDAAMEVKK